MLRGETIAGQLIVALENMPQSPSLQGDYFPLTSVLLFNNFSSVSLLGKLDVKRFGVTWLTFSNVD